VSGHAKMPPASHQVSATSLELLIQQIHPHVRVGWAVYIYITLVSARILLNLPVVWWIFIKLRAPHRGTSLGSCVCVGSKLARCVAVFINALQISYLVRTRLH
jgi:hypothetical protein